MWTIILEGNKYEICMYMFCIGFVTFKTYFVVGEDLDESFSSEILESISDELLLLLFTGEGDVFISGCSSFDTGNPNRNSVASKLISSMCVVEIDQRLNLFLIF